MEPQVLKPIVKNHAINRKSIQDPEAELITISPDSHNCLGTTPRHQEWLIACFIRSDQQTLTIRHYQIWIRTCASIAPAENRHPFPLCQEPIGEQNDHRRFSRPSQCEIPDTQHRNR
jgi:hypothetical protein